jgi:hypothetical protein
MKQILYLSANLYCSTASVFPTSNFRQLNYQLVADDGPLKVW